ncbi:minor capsid protein [Anaerosporobacter faecicola]|uniref:minor capsid protein n=1 Tax=Anaerosporobacter faecicola TaxID=2718714 RepID=UPI00143BEF55|nr:minor capsid protein [Anaerosporobacter faecicola]
MQFNAHLDMKPTAEMVKSHGLGKYGEIQKFVDSECLRVMSNYTPMLTGAMEKSATAGTVIGSGVIEYISPSARFQYYGNVMIDPNTGSTWAPKGGKKVVTDRKLVHNKSRHPQAGPLWFERAMKDHKEEILKGAQEIASRG